MIPFLSTFIFLISDHNDEMVRFVVSIRFEDQKIIIGVVHLLHYCEFFNMLARVY